MGLKLADIKKFDDDLKSKLSRTTVTSGKYSEYTVAANGLHISFIFMNQMTIVQLANDQDLDNPKVYVLRLSGLDFSQVDLADTELRDLLLTRLTLTNEPLFEYKERNTYTKEVSVWYTALSKLQKFLRDRKLLDNMKYGG